MPCTAAVSVVLGCSDTGRTGTSVCKFDVLANTVCIALKYCRSSKGRTILWRVGTTGRSQMRPHGTMPWLPTVCRDDGDGMGLQYGTRVRGYQVGIQGGYGSTTRVVVLEEPLDSITSSVWQSCIPHPASNASIPTIIRTQRSVVLYISYSYSTYVPYGTAGAVRTVVH